MSSTLLDIDFRPDLIRPADARIAIIANAFQTVDETLAHYRMAADDEEVLNRNNEFYLERYRAMVPTVDGARREIIDAVNAMRTGEGGDSLIDEHNSCSLNGVYLYSFLSRNGYEGKVELIDNLDLEVERARQIVTDSDVVLLSTTFITSVDTIVRLARLMKEWNPRAKVIVGGAKLTQYADESEIVEAARSADALILSPNGEKTLLRMIPRLMEGRSVEGLLNVAYHDGEFHRSSRNLPDGVDIDSNFVRWSDLPPSIVRSSLNLRTGRGCPFKCKFCTFPSYNDQKVDLMSTESVIAQLREIQRMPEVKSIRFVDDTLFLNRNHLISVCQGMIDIGFDLPWTAYLRSTTLTEESCRYLSEAGCKLVLVGVESADQTVLDNMLKGTKEKHNWTAAANLAKYGILGFAFILTGFPGETTASVDKTIDFLNNSGIQSYVHSPLFVFPNSPVAREAQAFGLTGGFNDWAHPTMDCRTAIEESSRIFQEVTNCGYIDRGSSVTKVLLDHGYSVDQVKELAISHNQIARDEMNGVSTAAALAAFRRLALDRNIGASSVGAFTSPYARTGGALHINSSARY
ncbi:B12-binding domain-containing radical SAM protein [Kitasatospora phosalacinea]|uniref:B12-binding domain-containing radical SAM protein n=1 Tax=Kitasatospora phosalacinea TaxID=2065 RepID=UPI003651C2C6